MPEDRTAGKLEQQTRELQRLIDEAERLKGEIADKIDRLRRGGEGEHTDGTRKRSHGGGAA